MNHKSIALSAIIVWSIVAILFTGIFIYLLVGRSSMFSLMSKRFDTETIIEKKTLDSSDIHSLDIDWYAGQIQILPSTGQDIIITQSSYYQVDPFQSSIQGDILEIHQTDSGFYIFPFSRFHSSNITIEVPTMYLETLQLSLTSGSCNGNDLAAEHLYVSITSGRLTLNGRFQNITSELTSGNISIETNTPPDNLSVEMTSGDMALTIPDNDGFQVKLDKTSGRFQSDFDFMVNPDQEDIYIYKSKSTRQYSVDMTSGHFELRKLKTTHSNT
jgi:DUF4097 and DUF4098 domain-containing protein YvlB